MYISPPYFFPICLIIPVPVTPQSSILQSITNNFFYIGYFSSSSFFLYVIFTSRPLLHKKWAAQFDFVRTHRTPLSYLCPSSAIQNPAGYAHARHPSSPPATIGMPRLPAMIVNHNRRIIFCSIDRQSELIYVEMS